MKGNNMGKEVKYIDYPLGSLFKYGPDEVNIYVKLQHRGLSNRGVCVEYAGIRTRVHQGMFDVTEEDDDIETFMIYPVDFQQKAVQRSGRMQAMKEWMNGRFPDPYSDYSYWREFMAYQGIKEPDWFDSEGVPL